VRNHSKLEASGAQPLCPWFSAGLIAGLLVALGTLTSTQPCAAQAGKVEKSNVTFGVFPVTNYGVVYLSLQQGFFQAEGLNVMPRMMGMNPVAGIIGGISTPAA
jgi:hypothetical protein